MNIFNIDTQIIDTIIGELAAFIIGQLTDPIIGDLIQATTQDLPIIAVFEELKKVFTGKAK